MKSSKQAIRTKSTFSMELDNSNLEHAIFQWDRIDKMVRWFSSDKMHTFDHRILIELIEAVRGYSRNTVLPSYRPARRFPDFQPQFRNDWSHIHGRAPRISFSLTKNNLNVAKKIRDLEFMILKNRPQNTEIPELVTNTTILFCYSFSVEFYSFAFENFYSFFCSCLFSVLFL